MAVEELTPTSAAAPTPAAATPPPAPAQAPTPAPAAAGPPPAAPTPASPPPAANWRDDYVKAKGGDERMRARLERYQDVTAVIDSLISTQTKISAGELKVATPFPKDGTPEQQVEWRKAQGIPEAPDKYSVQLGGGRVIGEDDKPMIDSFLKGAHNANMPPAYVNATLNWYYDTVEAGQAARAEEDRKIKESLDDKLRVEWGSDYRANKAVIEAFLDTGPAGTKDAIFSARLADGTPLVSNYDVIRFLVGKAREFNPPLPLTPGGGEMQAASIEQEMADLMRKSQAPKGSAAHNQYWKEGGDKRYRELVGWRDKLAAKK